MFLFFFLAFKTFSLESLIETLQTIKAFIALTHRVSTQRSANLAAAPAGSTTSFNVM